MLRKAVLLGSLVAACSSAAKQGPEETLGSRTHATKAGSGAETSVDDANAKAAADSSLPFRLAFQNPGGMWMPQQMADSTQASLFQKLGVQIAAQALANPLGAPLASVVSLGGCTGSFVSDQGLIVTNHHCVQGALQLNTDAQHDLVGDGFLAKTLADEKPAGPSQRVLVAQAFTDVTAKVRAGLDDIRDPAKRKDTADVHVKQLIADCERDRPWVRCQVSSFFGTGLYELIEMLEIRDVRVVYAPARSVGNYGGEVDNWGWPRHTGDWSFYRAYVGKDGKPAAPSPDNVPYRPAHWLRVTTAGLKAGDFVMVAGYPGVTTRTQLASAIHFDLDSRYPYLIENLAARYAVLDEHVKDGGETTPRATVQKQRVQNYLAKYRGILAGFAKKPELIARVDDLQKKIVAWAAEDGHEETREAIEKLEALEAAARKTSHAELARSNTLSASMLLAAAVAIGHWTEERPKPDVDRKLGFQLRDLDRARSAQKQLKKQYDRVLDRALLRVALIQALAVPAGERPWLAPLLGAKPNVKLDEAAIDKALDEWYASPSLEDEAMRLDLLEHATWKQLEGSKDPFIRAVVRVWPALTAEDKLLDARAGERMLVEPKYIDAMKHVLGDIAPDANGTLRVTYGTVKSLTPDAKSIEGGAFTVASQLAAKNTGTEPFNAPQAELDAIAAKKLGHYGDPALGGELAIDFESDLDITNGNSGSPTINNKGELVGLAFDGNREGLASDVVFDGSTTRTIQVDARYMIWTMDLLDGAQRLIIEMGLKPQFSSASASVVAPGAKVPPRLISR